MPYSLVVTRGATFDLESTGAAPLTLGDRLRSFTVRGHTTRSQARLISSIVGCPQTPEALELDMAVRATFVDFDGFTVLCFEPEGSAA